MKNNNMELPDIICMSFGYKHGIPTDTDYVFDVRCFPNPFYVEELKNMTGLDDEAREYVFSSDEANGFLEKLFDMIDYSLNLFAKKERKQLTISIGCTGGKHRSVAVTEALSSHLKAKGLNVTTVHRDIEK